MSNTNNDRALPLFQTYPDLAEEIPRLALGDWPTPVTNARRFADAQGLKAFYVKREDLSHAECGGNKLRGLEFLLAEAKQKGAETILTFSSAGSHHICKTAWHANKLGIRTVAVIVKQPVAEYVHRNLYAGVSAGAKYVPASYITLLPKFAWQLLKHKFRDGQQPPLYLIPTGGTSPLSCVGHVNAAFELKRQIETGVLPEPDYLYAALGSLGTMAGLALGCKLAGLKTKLIGVVVSYRWYCTPGRWARLARRTLRDMRRYDPNIPTEEISPTELTVIGTALGRGYAHFSESSLKLARRFHDNEGIRLDGTYTAKTLEGAMQFIRERALHDKVHLFWHSFHEMPCVNRSEVQSISPVLRRYFTDVAQPSV